jgi:hypothetical protein
MLREAFSVTADRLGEVTDSDVFKTVTPVTIPSAVTADAQSTSAISMFSVRRLLGGIGETGNSH